MPMREICCCSLSWFNPLRFAHDLTVSLCLPTVPKDLQGIVIDIESQVLSVLRMNP